MSDRAQLVLGATAMMLAALISYGLAAAGEPQSRWLWELVGAF